MRRAGALWRRQVDARPTLREGFPVGVLISSGRLAEVGRGEVVGHRVQRFQKLNWAV